LQTTLALGAGVLAAACGGQPASPTAAPKPTEAAKPAAEPTKPAAAAPAAAPTAAPAATKPAEPTKPAAAATAPAPAPAGQVKPVPRNRTLIVSFHASNTQFPEAEIWSPYCVGGSHQLGAGLFYEPLAYYSAFADKTTMWLAESYKYSPDFKELTIKLRPGITWSDGKPFSAEDVAFTLNSLKELGPKVNRGIEVQRFVESATATDATTVVVKFKIPAPRFFYFMTYKYDIGLYIVPKHVFEGQDWSKFTHYDPAKGWPITTAPWRVAATSPQQKLIDRTDSWWAVKAGLAQLPKMERIIYLPLLPDTQLAQSMITNLIDKGGIFQINTIKAAVAQNPKLITHAGRGEPYGYVDWWPLSLYLNNEKEPWNDKDVRWAISYFLDRQQMVDIAYNGSTRPSQLPMPTYPGLRPYFDAAKDLLEKFPTTKFDPARGTELLTQKGWKKVNGVWQTDKGQPAKLEIIGLAFLSNLGPVVVEQLKRQGIDAVFTMPPDAGTKFATANYEGAIFGHGGSVSGDPYFTLYLFQTNSQVVPGGNPANRARWKNAKYDELVDQIYLTPTEDQQKLIGLFRQAIQIFLEELPEVQLLEFYHYIAMNTEYWKGWPTKDDPYINGCSWHLTFPLVLMRLEPAQ
jgi:peptide/nickel transport system substrate-binding protein